MPSMSHLSAAATNYLLRSPTLMRQNRLTVELSSGATLLWKKSHC